MPIPKDSMLIVVKRTTRDRIEKKKWLWHKNTIDEIINEAIDRAEAKYKLENKKDAE